MGDIGTANGQEPSAEQQAPEQAAQVGQLRQAAQQESTGRDLELAEARNQAQEWHAKADEYLDQLRRSVAEFANYRKRQDKERDQQTIFITMDVLKRLLPVVDDLQRAVRNVPEHWVGMPWVEGIGLIERKLNTILTDLQCVPIDALGQVFDPTYHSALAMECSGQYPAHTVMEELQKGYMVNDRVLRPTLVKVSNGPGPEGR